MTTELIKSKSKKAAFKNKLKGHDKSGTQRGKIRYAAPAIIGGEKIETSAGLRDKIRAFPTSKDAWKAMVAYYKSQGYVLRSNHEMYKEGEPVLILPKQSKMIRLKTGKAGRAVSVDARGGIIL